MDFSQFSVERVLCELVNNCLTPSPLFPSLMTLRHAHSILSENIPVFDTLWGMEIGLDLTNLHNVSYYKYNDFIHRSNNMTTIISHYLSMDKVLESMQTTPSKYLTTTEGETTITVYKLTRSAADPLIHPESCVPGLIIDGIGLPVFKKVNQDCLEEPTYLIYPPLFTLKEHNTSCIIPGIPVLTDIQSLIPDQQQPQWCYVDMKVHILPKGTVLPLEYELLKYDNHYILYPNTPLVVTRIDQSISKSTSSFSLPLLDSLPWKTEHVSIPISTIRYEISFTNEIASIIFDQLDMYRPYMDASTLLLTEYLLGSIDKDYIMATPIRGMNHDSILILKQLLTCLYSYHPDQTVISALMTMLTFIITSRTVHQLPIKEFENISFG